MLYKVYVNLCDLGTKAAQSYTYMPFGRSMPDISAFGLSVHHQIFKKIPLFGPFLGVRPFMTPGTLFA